MLKQLWLSLLPHYNIMHRRPACAVNELPDCWNKRRGEREAEAARAASRQRGHPGAAGAHCRRPGAGAGLSSPAEAIDQSATTDKNFAWKLEQGSPMAAEGRMARELLLGHTLAFKLVH